MEHIDNNAKTSKDSDLGGSEPKRASSLKYDVVKANDYSVIEFEQDVKARKALDIEKEADIKNNCLAVDDSAVDLDDDIGVEPGYESLNDVKQRINSSDFSNRLSRIKDLTDFHSANVGLTTDSSNSHEEDKSKATFDDSALNLSEVNLNNSKSDPLTSSSKSKDSGFESSKTQSSPDSVPVKFENEEYNADELEIDPGYAECADAIKGTIPLAAFSDGSGSKLSSCQSLDAALDEDEPDYAECADALKGGAVRMRISVSNERLAANDKKSRKTKSNEHIKTSTHSELYANPQILFKKRSIALLTDRSSGEFSNRSSETDRNESFTFSSSESLHKDTKEEQTIVQAPPLPARNYSLYLDNEEAAEILPDEVVSQNISKYHSVKEGLNQTDDNAFEDFGYAAVDEVRKQIQVTTQEISSSISENRGTKNENEDKVVNPVKDDKFNEIEDFGYASVEEAKNMKSNVRNVQDTELRIENCVSDTKESCKDEADFDFGYASVSDVRKEKSITSDSKSENSQVAEMREKVGNKETDFSDNRSSLEIAKLKQVKILEDTFGYASVSDVRKEKSVSSDSKSENLVEAKMREKVGIKGTDLIDNRSSFEIAKLRHVKILEDKFGYASVNNLKRQSNELTSKTIPYSEETINEICDTLQQNTNISDKKLDDFGYTSVKEHSKTDSEIKPNISETSNKPRLKLNSLDLTETDNAKVEYLDKQFTTSPVSEVVSSKFLCSTPGPVNQSTPQSVQDKSSKLFEDGDVRDTLRKTVDENNDPFTPRKTFDDDNAAFTSRKVFGEDNTPVTPRRTFDEDNAVTSRRTLADDSMEVTVHEMGGNCRVLRITEKEEPESLIQKRKSVRSSQIVVSQNIDKGKTNEIEKENRSTRSSKNVSQDIDTRKPNKIAKENWEMSKEVKSEIEPDQIDILSSKIEELKLIVSSATGPSFNKSDSVPADQNIVSGIQGPLADSMTEMERESFKHLSTDCTTSHEHSCLPKSQCKKGQCKDARHMVVDALKLPTRTNIQKVSYRSVTDSDSDDSDLKIENLPKLVIDESVFDDSDSSESLDKNITELSETISHLTEQIEKDVHLSETAASVVDKKGKANLPGLFESDKLSCSCKNEKERDLGTFISDSDCSNVVDSKDTALVSRSSNKNSNELSNTLPDSWDCNKGSKISEDFNEPVHMSLEEVISEPIHMTLEDALKQRHSGISGTDINVVKTDELGHESLFNLRDTLGDRDQIESKHKAISENQNKTEIENLHLENLHLGTSSNLSSCDESLNANDSSSGVGIAVPPRPPPPVINSPDDTEKATSGQQQADTTTDHGDSTEIPVLQSPGSDDADQGLGHLPLVFRPGSGSNQADGHEDDGSPPAIPPRVRIRKHARQGEHI